MNAIETKTECVALTAQQVGTRYGVAAATIREWSKRGAMPPCRRLSHSVSRWMLTDLQEWEASDFSRKLREATSEEGPF